MIDRRELPIVTLVAVVLFAVILLLTGTGTAAGAGGCDPINGSTNINESGCYELTGDALNSPNETYIEIQASDVILDGMGHTVDGDDSSNSIGVFVNGSTGDRLSNVTVKNLTLTDWETGLYYDTSEDGAILNAIATSNTDYGIHLQGATNVTVDEVTTADHQGHLGAGLRIEGSADISVSGLDSTNNQHGVYVFGGSGHMVADSTFTDDTGVSVVDALQVTILDNSFPDTSPAVSISDSGDVLVDNNTIVDGSLGSISGTNGPANRITNNSIYESSQYATGADCYGMTVDGATDDLIANNSWTECNSGVHIDDSDRIEFRNNTISGTDGANADYGLWVSGGADNRIVDNHIVDNGKYPKRAGILLGTHQAALSGNTLAGNGFNLEIGSGGDWSSISHTIDATNTVEGRPVAYHVNETGVTVDPNAGWVGLIGTQNAVVADMDFAANNWENVLLRYADDTVIRNVTMSPSWVGVHTRDGSDRTRIEDSHFENGRGLSINEATGTTIVNTSVMNSNGYGVYLSESPDTSFENVTVTGSNRLGIGVRNGESTTQRVTVARSTVSDNDWGGIDFYQAARSSVRDSVVQNNGGAGIQAQRYVHNTTITGNVINGNDGDGVTFSPYPQDNLIANNTITDNAVNGIELGSSGHDDTVYGNVLTGNAAGIYVPSTYDNLTVYDNQFNNTQNVAFSDPTGLTNATWNVTATNVTNIVGGPSIGGNFWANLSGDEFSQTCTDADSDGFCDSSFSFDGQTDYLPLTTFVTPVTGPNVDVSPTSHDFGNVSVGNASTTNVTVNNDGDTDLNVTGSSLSGDTGQFSVVAGAPFTLAPGDSRNVTVEFAPGSAGTFAANLTVGSNDSDEPSVLVQLSGESVDDGSGGGATGPDVVVTPSSYDFGDVNVSENASANVTVTNVGSAPLNVTDASISGPNASEFSIVAGGATTLSPGDSTNLTVRFAPATNVSKSAVLSVASNDSDEPSVDVPLSGTGVSVTGGGSGESATVTVNSITVSNGTDPGPTPYVEAWVDSQPMLQLNLRSSETGPYDLEPMGFDNTTEFRIDLTVENFTPRLLLGAGNVTSWERTGNGTNATDVTVLVRPVPTQSILDCDGGGICTPPSLNDWPEGTNDTATNRTNVTVSMAIDDLGVYPTAQRNALDGTVITTDAQVFGDPTYTPATPGQPASLSLLVAGPHNRTDGTLNQGFYDALLPKALLDAWGITDPENELTAAYDGQPAAIEVDETADGDAEIEVDVHYSAGEVSVSAQADDGGDGGSGGGSGSSGSAGSSDPGSSDDDEPTTTETTPTSTATTPTSTSTPTPGSSTTVDTPTESDDGTPTPGATQSTQAPPTTSSPGQPGFGLLVTVLALLAALLLAGRRR